MGRQTWHSVVPPPRGPTSLARVTVLAALLLGGCLEAAENSGPIPTTSNAVRLKSIVLLDRPVQPFEVWGFAFAYDPQSIGGFHDGTKKGFEVRLAMRNDGPPGYAIASAPFVSSSGLSEAPANATHWAAAFVPTPSRNVTFHFAIGEADLASNTSPAHIWLFVAASRAASVTMHFPMDYNVLGENFSSPVGSMSVVVGSEPAISPEMGGYLHQSELETELGSGELVVIGAQIESLPRREVQEAPGRGSLAISGNCGTASQIEFEIQQEARPYSLDPVNDTAPTVMPLAARTCDARLSGILQANLDYLFPAEVRVIALRLAPAL